MTIKSRLWAALPVALAMVLAAGLAAADPAAAGPDDADLSAADASELGAVLDVQYEAQPDGYIRTTEYENATVTEFELASCRLTTTAYRPTVVGSNLRGKGYFAISSGCSGTWKVQVNLKLRVYNEWTPIHHARSFFYPPYSGTMGAATNCRKGDWITEIFIERGNELQVSRSSTRRVSSC